MYIYIERERENREKNREPQNEEESERVTERQRETERERERERERELHTNIAFQSSENDQRKREVRLKCAKIKYVERSRKNFIFLIV